MSASLDITVALIDGSTAVIPTNPNETVRMVISRSPFRMNSRSNILCFSKGRQLCLDLSLQAQGIKTDDIIVFLNKKKTQTPALKRFMDSNRHQEIQQKIYAEAIRVSDIPFLIMESSKIAVKNYKTMLELQHRQEIEFVDPPDPEPPKINPSPQLIPTQPLPPCWQIHKETQTLPINSAAVYNDEWNQGWMSTM